MDYEEPVMNDPAIRIKYRLDVFHKTLSALAADDEIEISERINLTGYFFGIARQEQNKLFKKRN